MSEPRIVRTADTCGGKSRIDGTRITTRVVYLMWYGNDAEYVRKSFPSLTVEQIGAAVRYERRPHRRFCWWLKWSSWTPEFEGTITWRGREWEF